jgi:hypothetical protein
MSLIHVYLEGGFDHDRVTVSADGVELEEADATTRYQIGLASAVELTIPDGLPVVLAVAVPDRGLRAEATVDPATTPHVRVDARGGSLVLKPQAAPPMFA